MRKGETPIIMCDIRKFLHLWNLNIIEGKMGVFRLVKRVVLSKLSSLCLLLLVLCFLKWTRGKEGGGANDSLIERV